VHCAVCSVRCTLYTVQCTVPVHTNRYSSTSSTINDAIQHTTIYPYDTEGKYGTVRFSIDAHGCLCNAGSVSTSVRYKMLIFQMIGTLARTRLNLVSTQRSDASHYGLEGGGKNDDLSSTIWT
jgi:hypothetical protein